MKLTQLTVYGYRSLLRTDWSPADLNVIVGPNASGKSNLLQILQLISVSARAQLTRFIAEQGGLSALVFDGRRREIDIEMTVDSPDNESDISTLRYSLALALIGDTSSAKVSMESLLASYNLSPRKKTTGNLFERVNSFASYSLGERSAVSNLSEEDVPLEETVLSVLRAQSSVHSIIKSFGNLIANWLILDDFHTDKEAPVRQATVTRFDERLEADGQNLVAVLHTLYSGNREFKQAVDNAMSTAFGEEYEELTFTPAGEQRIQLAVRWSKLKRPQTAANLSDGTLRFLFLITALAQPNPPALIAIDEPETGLHPSMMRIIAEYAQEASRHTQVVLSTHSPALLDAFTEAQPTVTVCELKGGATVLKNLDGDTLKYWLSKYSLGELQQSGQLEAMLPAPEAA